MVRPKSYGTTSYPGLGFSVTWALHGAENPEADRHSWRVESGTGRAFGLKQSSYRPEGWQHLMLEGLKGFIAPGRIWRWTWWILLADARVDSLWVARAQSLWVKRTIRTGDRSTGVLKPHIFTIIIYEMAIGTFCTGQVKHSQVQDHSLTLGQFVLLPMQGWRWPVLKMFAISAIRL